MSTSQGELDEMVGVLRGVGLDVRVLDGAEKVCTCGADQMEGMLCYPDCAREAKAVRPCSMCGYEFDIEAAGKYGCPNCHGEGLEEPSLLQQARDTLVSLLGRVETEDDEVQLIENIDAQLIKDAEASQEQHYAHRYWRRDAEGNVTLIGRPIRDIPDWVRETAAAWGTKP